MTLYWDIVLRQICVGTGTSNTKAETPEGVQGAIETVTIVVMRSGAVGELGVGESIVFAAKGGDLSGGYLFSGQEFAVTGSGESAQYSCDVAFNGAAIPAALDTGTFADVKAELCVVTSNNAYKYRTVFDFRIHKAVISGETPPSVPGAGLAMRHITNAAGVPGLGFYDINGDCIYEMFPPGV